MRSILFSLLVGGFMGLMTSHDALAHDRSGNGHRHDAHVTVSVSVPGVYVAVGQRGSPRVPLKLQRQPMPPSSCSCHEEWTWVPAHWIGPPCDQRWIPGAWVLVRL